jgi:2-polyprenyl-3-methyl-5-hydroxy-6-metoxy-1,4-benzoquinol methylase
LLESAAAAGMEPATEASVRENLLSMTGAAALDEYARRGKQFDVILCTLVLCSVPDPASLLSQVHDRLVPGGRFYFFEHVGAPADSTLASLQRLLDPLWHVIADGCQLSRDTARLVHEAGFDEVEVHTAYVDAMPIAPHHVLGVATKKMAD